MADILQIALPDGTTYNLKDSTAVTNVSWDSTNWKIQKTINGNTTDVIAIPIINGTGTSSAKMNGCTASGNYSFAVGENSQATGVGAIALISGVASQAGAIAIGSKAGSSTTTTASGIGAIAIGTSALANNVYTIALGYKANATGTASIAIGAESTASANYSLAFGGRGTKASSQYQTTLGKWNIEDDQDTYALIIGNGASDNERSNALAVDWYGGLHGSDNALYYNNEPLAFERDKIFNVYIDINQQTATFEDTYDDIAEYYSNFNCYFKIIDSSTDMIYGIGVINTDGYQYYTNIVVFEIYFINIYVTIDSNDNTDYTLTSLTTSTGLVPSGNLFSNVSDGDVLTARVTGSAFNRVVNYSWESLPLYNGGVS